MRQLLYRFLALVLLIASVPLIALLYILTKLSSQGPVIFRQKRVGKDNKVFTIYKIRTMVVNAEKLKNKYRRLNEASGPVFKIRNDPRYTWFGKYLSHTGLDELPQLVNIIKGEMSFVGPRPLPIDEAKNVPRQYQKRLSVLPGITSARFVEGNHDLSFDEWMKLDMAYIQKKSFWYDLKVILQTIVLILGQIINGK